MNSAMQTAKHVKRRLSRASIYHYYEESSSIESSFVSSIHGFLIFLKHTLDHPCMPYYYNILVTLDSILGVHFCKSTMLLLLLLRMF